MVEGVLEGKIMQMLSMLSMMPTRVSVIPFYEQHYNTRKFYNVVTLDVIGQLPHDSPSLSDSAAAASPTTFGAEPEVG